MHPSSFPLFSVVIERCTSENNNIIHSVNQEKKTTKYDWNLIEVVSGSEVRVERQLGNARGQARQVAILRGGLRGVDIRYPIR